MTQNGKGKMAKWKGKETLQKIRPGSPAFDTGIAMARFDKRISIHKEVAASIAANHRDANGYAKPVDLIQ